MIKVYFERYDAYKNSDIEWIENLPTDWKVKRLKEILSEVIYGTSEKTKEFGKYEVLGMGDINEGKVSFPKKRFIDDIPEELLLKKEDLLFNRTNSIALVGKVGRIEEDLKDITFASYLIKLRVNKNQSSKYFWYFLNSEYFLEYSRSNAIQTANQANLSSSKLRQFKIIDIPLNLQKTIADYLDTKTAQIDKKINLLTQKATLYSNLKQSLINETVTRGLDKSAPRKDSGVEWIGEIPKHWGVYHLKNNVGVKITDGPHETPIFTDEGVPFISAEAIQNGRINFASKRGYISEETDKIYSLKCKPKKDDIFIVKSDLRRHGEYVYDKIMIVVDRLQLRSQIDSKMLNMNIDNRMYVEANNKKTFQNALKSDTRLVIVNLQKFGAVREMLDADTLQKLAQLRIVFLIDEIHRSNSGDQHEEMVNIFDELQTPFDEQTQYNQTRTKKNLIVGFTATPDDHTLARFGEFSGYAESEKLWVPFDSYTMKEAIEDGFILNPLKNIVPVASKMLFDIPSNTLEGFEEPNYKDVDKKDIYENRDRINAIAQYIADLLVKDVYRQIRGTGKAMLAV